MLFWGLCLHGQECPDPVFPLPGQTDVSVTSTISWEEVVGVTGYQISLGSTPGGTDILGEPLQGRRLPGPRHAGCQKIR